MSDDKELIVQQAADLIGYHVEALRYHVRHGRIPSNEYRVTFGALKRFVREHRNAKVRELALA
jgi:hypothetical protein